VKKIHADTVHPTCIFLFFVGVIGLTLVGHHPVIVSVSFVCASLYLISLKGPRTLGRTLRFVLPLMIIVTIANPLFNRRGATILFETFNNNWVTLESLMFGLVSGVQLASIILWFAGYQVVMTSDKFLYLFGKIAPSASLLITMTMRMIPTLQMQIKQIRISQQMLNKTPKRVLPRMNAAIRHISTLLSWSMENAVEMADSMKARGYGIRRRTTFHLFRFDSRDSVTLCLLLLLCGVCVLARSFGHGTMQFFPRTSLVITGVSGMVMYATFALLGLLPTLFEVAEHLRHRRIFSKGGKPLGSFGV